MQNDSGWDAGDSRHGYGIIWTRTWTLADGTLARAVVEALDNIPGWFYPTDSRVAYSSLAQAKRYATTHPHYPDIRL